MQFVEEHVPFLPPRGAMPATVVRGRWPLGGGAVRVADLAAARCAVGRAANRRVRNAAVVNAILDETGPRLGLPTLQACCPTDAAVRPDVPAAWLSPAVPGGASSGDRDLALAASRCGLGDRS